MDQGIHTWEILMHEDTSSAHMILSANDRVATQVRYRVLV